jgi:hypothetical protein
MDIAIVGAGISGLYLGIELVKKGHNVTIIEKKNRLGGRIYTRHFMGYNYESGAGRFSNNHKLLLELIGRYDLKGPIKIGGHTIKCYPKRGSTEEPELDTTPKGVPLHCKKELIEYYKVIERALVANKTDLTKITTMEYLISIFGKPIADTFRLLYGYDGDLLLSSALCGTNILMDDYKSTQYYVLIDGLDKLVKCMAEDFTSNGGRVILGQTISTIDKGKGYYVIKGPKLNMRCHRLVLAIPPSAINMMTPSTSLKVFDFLKYVTPVPLLRVYFLYNTPQEGLRGLKKTVSKLDIRFIIPINQQIVMISYSDYKLAKKWKGLYEKNVDIFTEKILKEFTMETGRVLNKPDSISFEYWGEGVHVWGPNFNYLENYGKIIQPLEGLYLSNEAYSKKQGWLEGSLEMAKEVSRLISQ